MEKRRWRFLAARPWARGSWALTTTFAIVLMGVMSLGQVPRSSFYLTSAGWPWRLPRGAHPCVSRGGAHWQVDEGRSRPIAHPLPPTAACNNAVFVCKNEGHRPLKLYSSFVNDGVCGKRMARA